MSTESDRLLFRYWVERPGIQPHLQNIQIKILEWKFHFIEERSYKLMDVFHNFPLWIALFSVLFAQGIKIPLSYIASKKWDLTLVTSTGGMPSSHSAAVTSVSTAIGIEHGFDSGLFAICTVFGIIVMFDATGVRRHAGYHATVINQLVVDFNKFVTEAKSWQHKGDTEKREELKELLGHQPIEVFFGALLGILIAIIGQMIVFN